MLLPRSTTARNNRFHPHVIAPGLTAPHKLQGSLDRDAPIVSLAAYLDLLGVRIMSKGVSVARLLLIVLICIPACAQCKGDHIHGFLGLESRTQAPAGLYAWMCSGCIPPRCFPEDLKDVI
jgi:hypothetical protein